MPLEAGSWLSVPLLPLPRARRRRLRSSLGHPSARRSLRQSALPPPSACCCALPHPARLVACGMDELVAADAAAAWRAADPERRLRSDVAASTHDGGGAGCERAGVCGAVPPSACRLAAHPKEAAALSSSDVRGAAAGCSASAAPPLHACLRAPAGAGWSVDDAQPRCLRVTRAELARPPPHRCSGSARALAVRPTSSLPPPPFLASSPPPPSSSTPYSSPYSSTMASVVQGIVHLVQGLFEAALGLVRGIFSAALAVVNTIFSTIFGLLVSQAQATLLLCLRQLTSPTARRLRPLRRPDRHGGQRHRRPAEDRDRCVLHPWACGRKSGVCGRARGRWAKVGALEGNFGLHSTV